MEKYVFVSFVGVFQHLCSIYSNSNHVSQLGHRL